MVSIYSGITILSSTFQLHPRPYAFHKPTHPVPNSTDEPARPPCKRCTSRGPGTFDESDRTAMLRCWTPASVFVGQQLLRRGTSGRFRSGTIVLVEKKTAGPNYRQTQVHRFFEKSANWRCRRRPEPVLSAHPGGSRLDRDDWPSTAVGRTHRATFAVAQNSPSQRRAAVAASTSVRNAQLCGGPTVLVGDP